MFPTEIYAQRRKKLSQLVKSGVGLFLGNVEVPCNYAANTFRFRQDSNFLYFWGVDLPNFAALIDFEKNETILFGNEPELDDIIWSGPQPKIQEIAEKSGISKAFPLDKLPTFIESLIHKGQKIKFLAPYQAELRNRLSALLHVEHHNLNKSISQDLISAVVKLRSTKDVLEIAEIEEMVHVAWIMHTTAMKLAKPGTTERQIAGTIEGISLSLGHSVSFPIICSIHGETLHNPYYSNTLQQGQLLLTDAGSESLLHYASDITRTTPVGGHFTEIQKEIYTIVLQANLETIRIATPGISYLEVHKKAALKITQGLIDIGLMRGDAKSAVEAGAHALFFPHGLGHMMGLDVHDMENLGEDNVGYDASFIRSHQFGLANLRMARKLEPGFVITDEPGIYFIPTLIDLWKQEKKFSEFINYEKLEKYRNFGGIRIEDDLLITKTGCRVLGKPIPKTIEEVENTCLEKDLKGS
jgi:Xaa-Pro aminopeptidase